MNLLVGDTKLGGIPWVSPAYQQAQSSDFTSDRQLNHTTVTASWLAIGPGKFEHENTNIKSWKSALEGSAEALGKYSHD